MAQGVKVGLGKFTSKSTNTFVGGNFKAVRVIKVILNNKDHPDLFKRYGEWASLGMVFFKEISDLKEGLEEQNIAYPLFPNIKNFPLENEIIYITNLPSDNIYSNTGLTKYYYFTPLNIWNNIHHNSIPSNLFDENKNLKSTPTDIFEGDISNNELSFPKIKFGKYFTEKNNVKTLQPFEGDIIYEGRWGQSIRFGSNQSNLNPWSNEENQINPITIIKNGNKSNLNEDIWAPYVENINEDPGSIYMTSTQTIPINVTHKNYKNYKNNPPTDPNLFNKPQIILNSERILINAKDDHILLSGNKSINLNSNSTNIYSRSYSCIDSPQILLGNKNADEPLIMGNKWKDLMNNIITELINVNNQLAILTSLPPGTPFVNLNLQASKSLLKLNIYKNQLNNVLSKNNFTI